MKKRVAPYHAYAVFRHTVGLNCGDLGIGAMARLHRAPNKAGIVVANLTPERRTARIECDWEIIGLTPGSSRWTSTATEDWADVECQAIEVKLAAYEVGLVCVDGIEADCSVQ